jgi:hypothetical protein
MLIKLGLPVGGGEHIVVNPVSESWSDTRIGKEHVEEIAKIRNLVQREQAVADAVAEALEQQDCEEAAEGASTAPIGSLEDDYDQPQFEMDGLI